MAGQGRFTTAAVVGRSHPALSQPGLTQGGSGASASVVSSAVNWDEQPVGRSSRDGFAGLRQGFDGLSCDNTYQQHTTRSCSKRGSSNSITECRVPDLIPVLGSQPAGDMSHKPSGRLPLLSTRPPVTLATFKRAATDFAAG